MPDRLLKAAQPFACSRLRVGLGRKISRTKDRGYCFELAGLHRFLGFDSRDPSFERCQPGKYLLQAPLQMAQLCLGDAPHCPDAADDY